MVATDRHSHSCPMEIAGTNNWKRSSEEEDSGSGEGCSRALVVLKANAATVQQC